jgi:DNA-binding PucR family transcriptional regulator
LLSQPEATFDAVEDVVVAQAPAQLLEDPVLLSLVRASNRSNLVAWAQSNLERPGEPVPPNIGEETLDIARDIVRRGLDDSALNSYRQGQNVAWQIWMHVAFELTDDPVLLREFLDVSARSIFAFVDETIAGIQTQVDQEREELASGAHAERLAIVNLLLEGAPISVERAHERLRYDLRREHTAAVLWSEEPSTALEATVIAAARAAGAAPPLTITATVRSLWAWFPLGADALVAALDAPAPIRVAVGATRRGLEGFRQSHLDALAAQRLMPPSQRLVRFEDVQLVALASGRDEQVADFVTRVLGPLSTGPAVLRDTLRTYLREGSNLAATARALPAHRNTVFNRIERARELLPQRLESQRLEVAMALEILHWRGELPGAA